MKRIRVAVTRMPFRLLALACVLMALIPPLVAYASSTTYATGTFGCCGYWDAGYNSIYKFNQVWHSTLGTWEVYYQTTTPPYTEGDLENNSNPTKWPYSIAYGNPWCHDINDNTGVVWTCQYGS